MTHPYQKLQQYANPSYFVECISSTSEGDTASRIATFHMSVEEAVDYCFYRTITPFVPTKDDTISNWLVDWAPILRMIQWGELFSDHNHRKNNDAMITPLTEVCCAIQKIVWSIHCVRLSQLEQFYKEVKPHDASQSAQNLNQFGLILTSEFGTMQLRSLQKTFLDLWMESNDNKTPDDACYHDKAMDRIVDIGIDDDADKCSTAHECHLTLTSTDKFMFKFISELLLKLCLDDSSSQSSIMSSLSNADNASYSIPKKSKTMGLSPPLGSSSSSITTTIQQYTQSLCNDIKYLIHPIELNPIINLYSDSTTFAMGHDGDTRVHMLLCLILKIRHWVEFLMGLLQLHRYCGEGQGTSDAILSVRVAISVSLSKITFKVLKHAGVLIKEKKISLDDFSSRSSLDIIRWIEESLQYFLEKYQTRDQILTSHLTETKTEKATMPTHSKFRCIIKGCCNMGKLSCGLCKRHIKAFKINHQPHPFNWSNEIPSKQLVYIFKRLKRHGTSTKDNLNAAIIEEVKRMRQQKRSK